MNVKIEEYEPGLLDRLISRGAKFEPSLTGTPKIKISKELDEEKREKLIKHERVHLHLFRYYMPAWLILTFLLSFLGFSYFFWSFIIGLFLWEGLAVARERGWI